MRNTLKKILLTVLACFIGTFLFAQQQKSLNQAEIEKKAAAKTAVLKQKLNLREEQERTIGDLTRMIALKSAQGSQPQSELDEYYNSEVAKVLDDAQMEIFKSFKPDNAVTSQEKNNVSPKPKASRKK